MERPGYRRGKVGGRGLWARGGLPSSSADEEAVDLEGKEYRAFGEEVPITALVSQIPADVDVGRTQAKDGEEPPRKPVVSAEMQRIQALEGKMDTIAHAVQTLADTNSRRGAATVGESPKIPEPTAAQLQELRALREFWRRYSHGMPFDSDQYTFVFFRFSLPTSN